MKKPQSTKQNSRLSIVLFGFFFLYLAYAEGEINGNSVPLFLLGLGLLGYGIIASKIIHQYLLKKAGIIEIDLDEHKDQE